MKNEGIEAIETVVARSKEVVEFVRARQRRWFVLLNGGGVPEFLHVDSTLKYGYFGKTIVNGYAAEMTSLADRWNAQHGDDVEHRASVIDGEAALAHASGVHAKFSNLLDELKAASA